MSGGSSGTGGSNPGTNGGTSTGTGGAGYGWTPDTTMDASYDIQALWGSGPSDIWAAAGGGELLGGYGQIHYYDGAIWDLYFTNATPALRDVFGVNGGNNVFFVGLGPQFYELDSTELIDLAGQSGSGTTGNISVWASAADSVWVASESTSNPLRLWDGVDFVDTDARYRSPNSSAATAIWGSSANDVWAADGTGLLHFDGTGWTQSYEKAGSPFLDIAGTGPNDVWAVGKRDLVHFDGQNWEVQDDGTNMALNAVWVAGPDDVWLVGDSGRILHGGTQGFVSVPSGITTALYAIWGSGTHDIWAGGEGGHLIHYGPVTTPTTTPETPACNGQGFGCSATPCCSPFVCGALSAGLRVCQ